MLRPFRQVDVFADVAYAGNPVAVVLDGDGLDDDTMQASPGGRTSPRRRSCSHRRRRTPTTGCGSSRRRRSCRSPGTRPSAPATPGWPTVAPRNGATRSSSSARPAWSRCAGRRPVWRSPPRRCCGRDRVDDGLADELVECHGPRPGAVRAVEWVDNGPGWVAVLLDSAAAVLAVRPRFVDRDVGLVGPHPAGSPHAIEVRAFFPKDGALVEDPVTGSLNASLAQWLIGSGRADAAVRRPSGHRARPVRAGAHLRRRRQRVGGRAHRHVHRGDDRHLNRGSPPDLAHTDQHDAAGACGAG